MNKSLLCGFLVFFAAAASADDSAANSATNAVTLEDTREWLSFASILDHQDLDVVPGMETMANSENADVLAAALLEMAQEGVNSDDPEKRRLYLYALQWMGRFGGTNAIPFLLQRIPVENGDFRHDAVQAFITAINGSTNMLKQLTELIDNGRTADKGLVEAVFDALLHFEPPYDLPETNRAAYVAFVEENAFKYDVSPDFQWADKYLCKYRPGWTDSTNRLAVANRIVALPNVHPRTFDYFTAVISSFEPLRGGENEENGGSPGLPPPREGEPAHLPETFKTLQGGPK